MKRILILSALILLFISCQKREWGNPFDPNCPKELFTPTSFTATQMGDSIVLSWSQPNNQISGFVLEKNTADGSFTQLANPEKSTTKVADRNIEGGIKYGYQLYASAGSNTSNTVTVEITPLLNAKITTTAYTNITATSAIAGGNITADGGAAITARGVCWSTTENPTIANSKTTDDTGKGSFTSNVAGLTAGTTYYARAYATNSVGTAYGNQVTTTTVTILPIITTTTLSAVTATTITGGGNITSNGGAAVTACGVCWSTSQNPTTTNSKTTDGPGTGSFTSSISGLSPGVTYYVKAYATNSVGTVYGTEVTTTTTAISPVITTATVSAITATTVTSGGNILSDGGATVTIRGVCWSTSQNPTITDNKTSNSTGSGIFVSSITGLTPGVTYYLRAYATNNVGTSYGNQLTAATIATVSTLTTTTPSAITSSTASTGGNITSDGGAAVTARGVCWGTTANPTTTNSKTTDGSGIGSFTSNIAGLTPGVTYFIRAYATNSIGTVYGNEVTCKTIAILPVITTTIISAITSNTASSGGNITNDGGSAITFRGVCWSTIQNPTTVNSKTIDGTGSGSFTSSLSGLASGTTYYIKAYATNSAGTVYGNEVSITTLATLPVLTTTTVTDITTTTALSGGNITSDGGKVITVSGICWSTTPNPTISNSKTSDGTTSGNFISNITGLIPGMTYYFKSYAINSVGTGYGNQLTVNTIASLPAITTIPISNIMTSTATSGGVIINDGGTNVIERGICWSTTQNPTISNSKTIDGSGIGSFPSILGPLTSNTTYYLRAYATNSSGSGYGTREYSRNCV